MIRRVFLYILLVCVSVSLLASCGQRGNNGGGTVVTDGMGNEVSLAGNPERIISLTQPTDEILIEIVERDRIRALSYLSEDEGLSNVADKVDGIDKLGTNLEQVIAAQPDIVFVADWFEAEFISQLKEAGIQVYVVVTPVTIEEVKEVIENMALVLGAENKGEELIEWMDVRLDAVAEKVSGLSETERVRAMSIDSFYNTYGKGTTFDTIASHSGVINLAYEMGIDGWEEISKEQVIDINPDVILLPAWSYEGFDAEEFANEFASDKALSDVEAVKNGGVFSLPDKYMMSSSHYIVLGVEELAKAVYPELFEEE